mmetsp:Transcript_63057/g.176363  ORF Transcript_63057/g.176363 Transcript_63057/m.176363 type:complete len:97 (-) Transcript_63057:146-436(-)
MIWFGKRSERTAGKRKGERSHLVKTDFQRMSLGLKTIYQRLLLIQITLCIFLRTKACRIFNAHDIHIIEYLSALKSLLASKHLPGSKRRHAGSSEG